MKFYLFFFVSCFFCVLILVCYGIETPQFTVIHSESDFEIRLYRESSWMSAPVKEISFEKATRSGFHRLYQYIHGANTNSTRLMITAPVLTSVIPDAHGGLQYIVRYYVSPKFQGVPPHPFTELNLQFAKLGKRCIAVRKFSGFVRNNTVTKQVEALVTDLGRLQTGENSSSSSSSRTTTIYDKYAYTIAQYNASFHLTGRLNEVWMNISGLTRVVNGCQSI